MPVPMRIRLVACAIAVVLLYLLLASVPIPALVSTTLAYRNFFTPAQQLRELSD